MPNTKREVFAARPLNNMGNLDRNAIRSHKRSVSFGLSPEYVKIIPQRSVSTDMSVSVSPVDNKTITILSPSANEGDHELLAKLDAANKEFEKDQKSLSSLTPPKSTGSHSRGHSRQASISSIASNVSQCSNASNFDFEPGSPEELWNLWSRIVSDWDHINKRKHQYIKDLVRQGGVPHHFRGIVWQLLCGAYNDPTKAMYADYLKQTSPMEKMIRRDITRTYPDHDFFKEKNGLGQESLFNVMKAYSLHDREVGYCQGSGFIVGLLLMQMPEEEAFAVLVKLMQDYNMRELFKPSMAELGVCMYQLEYLIQELLPQLHTHFLSQNLTVTMFASSWFLTVFTTSFTAAIVCRIFDIFLMEGTDYIFRVAISILQLFEAHLLTLDMEGMIKFLSKESIQSQFTEAEQLVITSHQVKFSSKKLKKLEKEYNNLKSKEKEEEVELRRLRTENRLLRQRIENLEKETATLADRLIHDQVKCAQNQETILGLRKDLSLSRQYGSDCMHRLEELQELYEQAKRCSSASSQASLETSLPEADQNRLHRLQAEVKEMKERETEHEQTIIQQATRIKELENANLQLTAEPSTQLMTVQEELIACKLREAEANLSLKELQQKVYDLDKHWQRNMEKLNAASPNAKPSRQDLRQMTDDVMSLRLKEAQAIAELKDSKQHLMELETQNHISARQMKRLEKEKMGFEEKLDSRDAQEKVLQNTIQELERKVSNLDSKLKEDEMMVRLKDAEHSQLVAEMRRRVAELEIENQELVTEGQLVERGEKGKLHSQIADLQDEVLQLKIGGPNSNDSSPVATSSKYNSITGETESDYESDDLEMTMNAAKLCLTESLCGVQLENALGAKTASTNSGSSITTAPHPPNSFLDSSDTDTPERYSTITGDDGSSSNTHLKTQRRRKKKNSLRRGAAGGYSKDGIDLDKTPTQDTVDTQCFLVDSSQLSDIDTKCDNEASVLDMLNNAESLAIADGVISNKSCLPSGSSGVTRPKDFHVNNSDQLLLGSNVHTVDSDNL